MFLGQCGGELCTLKVLDLRKVAQQQALAAIASVRHSLVLQILPAIVVKVPGEALAFAMKLGAMASLPCSCPAPAASTCALHR